MFFFFANAVTRARRIPNVPRIHVRVINSALLALHRLPVFLSFSFSHEATFSNIPNCTDSIWGPSDVAVFSPLSPPFSSFLLLFLLYVSSPSLMYRSTRVYEFFLRLPPNWLTLPRGRYYADVTIISNIRRSSQIHRAINEHGSRPSHEIPESFVKCSQESSLNSRSTRDSR